MPAATATLNRSAKGPKTPTLEASETEAAHSIIVHEVNTGCES
jgi:hypothetical protein